MQHRIGGARDTHQPGRPVLLVEPGHDHRTALHARDPQQRTLRVQVQDAVELGALREEGAADLLALEPVAEGDREVTGELHGGSFLGSQDPLGRSGPDGEQLDRPECGLTAIVGQRSDKWE